VVTDDAPVSDETERLLRRLRVQHDVLWITPARRRAGAGPFDGLGDRSAFDRLETAPRRARRDVATRWAIPEFVGRRRARRRLQAADAAEAARARPCCAGWRSRTSPLAEQDEAVGALAMLDARSHVRPDELYPPAQYGWGWILLAIGVLVLIAGSACSSSC
jgi:hypothetical protein